MSLGFAAQASVPQKAPLDQTPLDAKYGFIHGHELARYAELKRKIFLNSDEQAEKARIAVDLDLTKSLERLLHFPSFIGSPLQALQNDALDFLFENVGNPKNTAVAAVLQALVKDKEIENPKNDRPKKLSLAGFKAEVLYQWSAVQPSVVAQIPAWLPGPVSQKIWQNVLAAQAQNASDSAHHDGPSQPAQNLLKVR